MKLGDLGRRLVKNHDLPFYLDTLTEVRERTLAEFRKRDDNWLISIDESWFWDPPIIFANGSISASMSLITSDRSTYI
jgi:hypothetical protein